MKEIPGARRTKKINTLTGQALLGVRMDPAILIYKLLVDCLYMQLTYILSGSPSSFK